MNNKRDIKMTYFTLDMDATYDNETPDSDGVQPMIYAVPLQSLEDVEQLAIKAGREFNSENSEECIGDLFERNLIEKGIVFQLIGHLDISFEERQTDYLADYLPHTIV